MKKVTFLGIFCIATLLVTCTVDKDRTDLRLKNHFIVTQMLQNDRQADKIILELERSNSPKLLSLSREVKTIVSWRKYYLQQKTNASLLAYRDSILTNYKKSRDHDDEIANEIARHRDGPSGVEDSVSTVNLFCWLLSAEAYLLGEKSENLPIFCDFSKRFPTVLDHTTAMALDTIRVLINTMDMIPKGYELNFDNVHCTNQLTSNHITPKIIRLGDDYLLEYQPKEKGKYVLKGNIAVSLADVTTYFMIENEFDVKN
jgi:hypothetical protein